MGTSPLQVVILDLGNVLAFHDNTKLFAELARLFQTSVETLRARLEGSGIWEAANRGQLPGDALRQALVQRLGAHAPAADDFVRVWSCHFAINSPMVDVVTRLLGRVKLVLLSNTHDLHVQYLRPRLPVLERFDALVFSCEVGLIKPEPEIYRRALSASGASASQAIFFDDVETYAHAAQAVGIDGRVFRDAAQAVDALRERGLALP